MEKKKIRPGQIQKAAKKRRGKLPKYLRNLEDSAYQFCRRVQISGYCKAKDDVGELLGRALEHAQESLLHHYNLRGEFSDSPAERRDQQAHAAIAARNAIHQGRQSAAQNHALSLLYS